MDLCTSWHIPKTNSLKSYSWQKTFQHYDSNGSNPKEGKKTEPQLVH